MIKGTVQQEDITLVSIYTPNIGPPKYVRQILMEIKGEINRNPVIVGDFNTPLTSVYRSSNRKSARRHSLKQHTRSNGFN